MKQYVILLATDDSSVEVAVKTAGTSANCKLNCARTSHEAVSLMLDSSSEEALAVVDLDLPEGGRALLSTIGGALPVIAIASREKPWLTSMLEHHRVGATILKPVSVEKFRVALDHVRSNPSSILPPAL
jgi:DNA-binding response OmpR family regulator